ncbi:LAQU0S04e02234g1_1 [Lachancea quebecensis]|uniref:Crossover junction endonuclease MUS81 n=1 Tax=Lachancea quebecensis TaxID=1654605 RepID=A0A0P1KQE6_9SACH|nr:LAQU0S04e02234g1_1 [Lachancea quebecensis]
MSLPTDLKPLYAEWLESEVSSVSQKSDKLAAVYGKALENLRSYEHPIVHPNALLVVKGIGNRIKNILRDHLAKYCKETGFSFPEDPVLQAENLESRKRIKIRTQGGEASENENAKKKRRYVPKRRSGAYAILLGLLESSPPRVGSSKNEIVAAAHKYCDHSFLPNPSTRDFHSGWSAIKTLLARELVVEEGRPKRFILTTEGEEMAHTLKRTDGIIFEDEDTYQRRFGSSTLETQHEEPNDNEVTADYSELIESARLPDSKCLSLSQDARRTPEAPPLAFKTHSLSGNPLLLPPDDIPKPRSRSPLRGASDNIIRARWNDVSYELWDPATYDIILIIDHREVKSKGDREFFANQLKEKGVAVDVRSLSLSDMVWIAKHKVTKRECVLNFMLERKRLDDFAMSIMDNRFVEQKNRLKKTGCKNIYYLVEETTSDTAIRMAEAIRTAVWITVIYNDFHVKRTKNSDDTVAWLVNMTEVIKNYYAQISLLILSPRDLRNQDDYRNSLDSFRKQFERTGLLECCQRFDCFQEIMEKKSLMTVKELYLRALMVNKGVSLEKAISIQSQFPTLKALLEAYRRCKTEEHAKSLIADALKNEPGTRKVGKALSETLWKTFGRL